MYKYSKYKVHLIIKQLKKEKFCFQIVFSNFFQISEVLSDSIFFANQTLSNIEILIKFERKRY
jgi:hypothetical protein